MNRELQSPLLAFFVAWPRKESVIRVGTAGSVGWEAEETQRGIVRHLPIALLALWKWGQEGTGRVAAGQSRGPVLRRGCQPAVRWGGEAQPCVQFPTGPAIRHRRCELPGMTYFPVSGQPWPAVGPAELLARPLPGGVTHCSAREPLRACWHSVTRWHPSPGCLSGLFGQRGCSSWANISVPGSGSWWGAGNQDSWKPRFLFGSPGAGALGYMEEFGKGFGCCRFHLLPLVGTRCHFEGDSVLGTRWLGHCGRESASLDALEQHVTALSPIGAGGPRAGRGFRPPSPSPMGTAGSGFRVQGSLSSVPGWQGRADTVPADRLRTGAHGRCSADERDGWKGARVLSRRCKACAGE